MPLPRSRSTTRDQLRGAALLTRIGVGCHQDVQPEQSHECPPPRAVREPPAPVHGIPPVGGRPAAAGSRVRRRPLEVQAHRAAVHRGAGRPRGHLRQRRAIMGLLEPGPGPARLQAGPLRSIEGDRRRGAVTVEIRRCGLVAGRTRLDHGEADLSAACLGNTSSRATAR